MKYAKIYILTVLVASFSCASYAGLSGFLNKASNAVDSAQNAADTVNSASAQALSLATEKDEMATKLASACSAFLKSKSKASEAVGNSKEAANFSTLAKNIASEKNLQSLCECLDSLEKESALDVVKNSTLTDKSAIQESLEYFVDGINEEMNVTKEAYALAKKSKDALANASVSEKAAALANMQALTKLSDRIPQDITNAKDTLKQYMEFAKKNGVDVNAIAQKISQK